MEKLNIVNKKPFKKAVKYKTHKEYLYTEENRLEVQTKCVEDMRTLAHVHREYRYIIEKAPGMDIIKFRYQTPEKLI